MKHFNLLDALIDYEIFFIVEKVFLLLDTGKNSAFEKWNQFTLKSEYYLVIFEMSISPLKRDQ